METERAIRTLDHKTQAPFSILATKKLRQIKSASSYHNSTAKRETYTLKNTNSKLVKENAMIVKADKGKTCFIIYAKDYIKKVHDFLNNNNFQKLKKYPTDKYQKLITETLQDCDLNVHKKQIKYPTHRKPQPPP
jgi:hypothetical protein